MERFKLIASLGEAIIEKLYELDDNYTYEADCEFGGFEADCKTYCFEFEYGNGRCEVEASVTWPYGKSASLEVLLYGREGHVENAYKVLSNLEKAVTDYLDEHLDTDDLLSVMIDDLKEAYEDEWQSHGFRDAADYYSWRYR